MRVRPVGRPDYIGEHGAEARKRPDPSSRPDLIEPLLVCGAYTTWPYQDEGFDPRASGAQLVCWEYIPAGRCGWINSLHVAPYAPSELTDPWRTSGAANFAGTASSLQDELPSGFGGLWETPGGWAAQYESPNPAPTWKWHLRFIKGDIRELRAHKTNLQPFDPAVPATWYLADVPVPASTYAKTGIPGAAPSGYFHANGCQILPSDSLPLQVYVPENTTVALFAEWTQLSVYPYAHDINGTIRLFNYRVYPILPTFGRLSGVVQKLESDAAVSNAVTAR